MFNANKVRGKLAEMQLTQKDVAKVWNCSLPTVSQKLNGLRPLFLDEAVSLANLLDLTDQEKVDIFFADQIA